MDISFFPIIGLLILLLLAGEFVKKLVAKKDMKAYYNSPVWAQKRREAFAFHGPACAICGTNTNLQVHHLRYRKWFTPIFGRKNVKKDLMILCKAHHPRGRYSRLEIAVRRIFFRLFHF